MEEGRTRIVQRIQQRLSRGEAGHVGCDLTNLERTELEARLRRLRAIDDRFAGAGLSLHVGAGFPADALC